jgi:low affinity Fe/Cu permease
MKEHTTERQKNQRYKVANLFCILAKSIMAKPEKPDIFTRFTTTTSALLGRPWIFVCALGVLLLWVLSGPLLGFSDTWQLIINTSTTIVTFLMVFIIQNTQNRDNLAFNIKQDAVMKKLGITAKDLLEAEDQSDVKLEKEKQSIQRRQRPKPSRKPAESRKGSSNG